MQSDPYKLKLRSANLPKEPGVVIKQQRTRAYSRKPPAGKENRKCIRELQLSKQKRNAIGKKPVLPANIDAISTRKRDTGEQRKKITTKTIKAERKNRMTDDDPESDINKQHTAPESSDHYTRELPNDTETSLTCTSLVKPSVDPQSETGNTLQSLRQRAGKSGVPRTGNKLQVLQRIQWYDKFKLKSCIINPVSPIKALDDSGFVDDIKFKACDEELQKSLKWLTIVKAFSYFQQRSARQGYKNEKLLKKAGFLRNVCYAKVNDEVYQIRCYCAAAMHKNRVYQIKVEHNGDSITKSNCECAAGSGNSAACKHVGALVDALQDFVRTGRVQQNETCTDILQTWLTYGYTQIP